MVVNVRFQMNDNRVMDGGLPIPEEWRPEVVEKWMGLKTSYPDWHFSWSITEGSDDINFRASHPKVDALAAEVLHAPDHDNVKKALGKLRSLEHQIKERIGAASA